MGTRADFYIGRGVKAEWLGSVGWDGDPENFKSLLKAKTEEEFRKKVAKEIAGREDGTKPEMGWPWPWNDGRLTDYSYAFDGGKTFHTGYRKNYDDGKLWLPFGPKAKRDEDGYLLDESKYERCVFPDMSARKAVTRGKRSGVLLFEGK